MVCPPLIVPTWILQELGLPVSHEQFPAYARAECLPIGLKTGGAIAIAMRSEARVKPAMARFFQLQTFENKIFLGTHFLHLQKCERRADRVSCLNNGLLAFWKGDSPRTGQARYPPRRRGGAIANDVAEEPHCLVLHRNDLIERLRLSHAPR